MQVPSKLIYFLFVAFLVSASAVSAQVQPAPGQAALQTQAPGAQPAASTQQPVLGPAASAKKTLTVVVLDPAHGGADAGARGSSGIAESEVVLSFARLARISLEAQGLHVILTRQANDGPSFDDRSKLANAQSGDVFITLHVSSTGQPGTVRVYSYPLLAVSQNAPIAPHSAVLPWDRAQFGFIDQSRKLAELIQIQMAQRFPGSAETPFEAPVRQLRTVAAPAVAIEVSSVSMPDRAPLDKMGPGLADAVARAVAAFQTIYESGAR